MNFLNLICGRNYLRNINISKVIIATTSNLLMLFRNKQTVSVVHHMTRITKKDKETLYWYFKVVLE